MTIERLYKMFDTQFEEVVLPYIRKRIEKNFYSEPIYYYLENFHLRTFRSSLPLLIGGSYNVDKNKMLPIGAASELIFFIALVQDDIIDDDTVRGSIEAAHVKYGVARSLASADYCLSYVFDMLTDISVNRETLGKILCAFKSSYQKLYYSFLSELKNVQNFDLNERELEAIHLSKTIQGTNALYCTGLILDEQIGTKLADIFRRYSELVALAAQIKNDIYDLIVYPKQRGFSDLKNGYPTYPIILLLNRNSDVKTKTIISIQENDPKSLMSLIEENQIIEKLRRKIDRLINESLSLLRNSNISMDVQKILSLWAEGNRKIQSGT